MNVPSTSEWYQCCWSQKSTHSTIVFRKMQLFISFDSTHFHLGQLRADYSMSFCSWRVQFDSEQALVGWYAIHHRIVSINMDWWAASKTNRLTFHGNVCHSLKVEEIDEHHLPVHLSVQRKFQLNAVNVHNLMMITAVDLTKQPLLYKRKQCQRTKMLSNDKWHSKTHFLLRPCSENHSQRCSSL